MLIFSRQGLLPQLPDLSAAAGPLSRHLVVLFRDISQKSTGKPLSPHWINSKTADKFCFLFFSHPTCESHPYRANRPYRRLVALSTMGNVAKWASKSFQQAMGMVWFFRKENKPVHCLDSNSKLHFLPSQKYFIHLNATSFYYGTCISCQNGYTWNYCNSCNDLLYRIH